MALPAVLLIDSDTANWQLQSVSQRKSGNVADLQNADGFKENLVQGSTK